MEVKTLKSEKKVKKQKKTKMSRVYLGRLPRDAETRDVEKLTSEFGRTRDVKVLSGFAFVEFENPRDAKDCIRDLDGSKFMGERYILFILNKYSYLFSIIAEAAKGGDRERRRFDDERKRERRRGEFRLAVLGLPSRTSWQVSYINLFYSFTYVGFERFNA